MRLSALLTLAAHLLSAAPVFADDEAKSFQTVVVRPGQTLWNIAEEYLKDPSRWDQILKHNSLPSSDPTVALPGMSLRVPINLIREDLRAAILVALSNAVSVRRKEAAQWNAARLEMQLYRDDALRTLAASTARGRFQNDDLLDLPADALAIIKPKRKDYLVELKRGGSYLGKTKILTAAATITPQTKDTRYLATVKEDLRTVVQVVKGKALVEAQHQSVLVSEGLATEVRPGAAPSPPTAIPDLPAFEKSVADFELGKARITLAPTVAPAAPAPGAKAAEDPGSTLDQLRVGQPISGYRVQLAADEDFSEPMLDKTLEPDVPLESALAGASGRAAYYRIAVIDLLGTQGKWSKPKRWTRK
jgi:hypothetical protein